MTEVDAEAARATCATSIAILAGGLSSRMGTDKALIRLTPNGPTLLERVVDRVRPLTDDLFVVATDRPAYALAGVPVWGDLVADGAVLGGIASAIKLANHSRCLVVSCDHPFLSVSLIAAMTTWPGDWDVLVPAIQGESRQGGGKIRQTLHAVYHKRCLGPIERALAGGHRQIIRFFPEVKVEEIDEAVVRQFDPSLHSLLSVNTPEALDLARRIEVAE